MLIIKSAEAADDEEIGEAQSSAMFHSCGSVTLMLPRSMVSGVACRETNTSCSTQAAVSRQPLAYGVALSLIIAAPPIPVRSVSWGMLSEFAPSKLSPGVPASFIPVSANRSSEATEAAVELTVKRLRLHARDSNKSCLDTTLSLHNCSASSPITCFSSQSGWIGNCKVFRLSNDRRRCLGDLLSNDTRRCLGDLQRDRLLLGLMRDSLSGELTIRASPLSSACGSTPLASSGTGSCSSLVAYSDETSLSTTSSGYCRWCCACCSCCNLLRHLAASTACLTRKIEANCVSAVRAVQRCEFNCCWRSITSCRFALLFVTKFSMVDVKRFCTNGKFEIVMS
mmetsp:Transcript_132533/g.258169  ORF Transcript_132533/g.258169 Transcript_132533/m.258169 type:complete len:339 (+) Transcript_132533:109-1125(+)